MNDLSFRAMAKAIGSAQVGRSFIALLALGLLSATTASAVPALLMAGQAADLSPQQRAELVKQSVEKGKEQIRKYEWIETSVITVDGKQKGTHKDQCYYGADGKLVKVAADDGSQKSSGGLPGLLPPGKVFKAVEKHKSKETAEFIQQSMELMHTYLPPSSEQIQQAIDAGNMAVSILEPGKRDRLDFSNYKKNGDKLGIEIDLETSQLLGISLSTYVSTPEDSVSLTITMGLLPDGTIYPQKSVLEAPSQQLTLTTEVSGLRPSGN